MIGQRISRLARNRRLARRRDGGWSHGPATTATLARARALRMVNAARLASGREPLAGLPPARLGGPDSCPLGQALGGEVSGGYACLPAEHAEAIAAAWGTHCLHYADGVRGLLPVALPEELRRFRRELADGLHPELALQLDGATSR